MRAMRGPGFFKTITFQHRCYASVFVFLSETLTHVCDIVIRMSKPFLVMVTPLIFIRMFLIGSGNIYSMNKYTILPSLLMRHILLLVALCFAACLMLYPLGSNAATVQSPLASIDLSSMKAKSVAPTITGTAKNTPWVNVYIDGDLISQPKVVKGRWSIGAPILTPGSYTVEVSFDVNKILDTETLTIPKKAIKASATIEKSALKNLRTGSVISGTATTAEVNIAFGTSDKSNDSYFFYRGGVEVKNGKWSVELTSTPPKERSYKITVTAEAFGNMDPSQDIKLIQKEFKL